MAYSVDWNCCLSQKQQKTASPAMSKSFSTANTQHLSYILISGLSVELSKVFNDKGVLNVDNHETSFYF